jgi:hypothetical protein
MVADGSSANLMHAAQCTCPVCLGLQPFERPIFAPGQVLTDIDLNADQAYALAKNRLHNRYLHGWGVVCGLEVVCNHCDGYVTIHPGYAIDRCGNDIVVAADQPFNVIRAIQDCCNARQKPRGQCDPYIPPPDPGCKDVESYWCVTLCYKEVEAARVMTLRSTLSQPAAPSCGCGCGGGTAQSGCSCGCHGSSKAGKSSTSMPSVTKNTASATGAAAQGPASCQPRRVLECFDIGLMENSDGCAPAPLRRKPDSFASRLVGEVGGLALADLIPPGSLLYNIAVCIMGIATAIKKRSYADDTAVLNSLDSNQPASFTAQQAHDAVCRYRQAMVDLYTADDHLARCQLPRVLGEITLDPPKQDESPQTYWPKAAAVYDNLKTLALQYMLDCVCHSILPPCPPDPGDDRVPIACVTVRGDKIIDICNFSCRHYAGAFPSLFYWLSAVPIVPLVSRTLQELCCRPDLLRVNSPLVNALPDLLSSLDPTGTLQRGLMTENFSGPAFLARQFLSLQPGALATQSASAFGTALTLPAAIGRPASDVQKELSASGLTAIARELPAGAPAPSSASLLGLPLSGAPQHVILYTSGGKVVGVTPASAADAVAAAKDAQILDLQNQLKAVRDDIALLKAAPPRPPAGGRK